VVPFLRGSSNPPAVAAIRPADRGRPTTGRTDRSVGLRRPPHQEVVAPRRR